MQFRAFPEWVDQQIPLLESVDYFGANEYFSGRKKKKKESRILISKTLMVRLTGLSLYANESCNEHAVYFRQ